MKYFLTLISIIIVQTNMFSQSIIKYYNYKWQETEAKYAAYYSIQKNNDTDYIRQDYYMATKSIQMIGVYRDSTQQYKIGKFYWFYPNNNLKEIGMYSDGEKHGVWLSYYENGALKDSTTYDHGKQVGNAFKWYRSGFVEDSTIRINDSIQVSVSWFDSGCVSVAGRYLHHKKNGSWNYYHRNGFKSAIETYNRGNLLSKTYFSETGDQVDTILYADRRATFHHKGMSWSKYLSEKLYSPTNVKLVNTDKVIVVVEFDVNEKGVIENVEINTPFHPEYDNIAKKIITNSPKWQPARYKNRYIVSHFLQPIYFAETEN